jgi:gliding motility-associated protein GldE
MPSQLFTLFGIIVLILCSALMSGSESAYFSLKARNLAHLTERNTAVARQVLYLHDRPKMLLSTILVANTAVNIMIAILATKFLNQVFGESESNPLLRQLVEVVGITFTLVIFGEVVPKIYTAQNNVSFAVFMAYPLLVLGKIFMPLSWVLIRSTNIIEKRLQRNGHAVSMDEIRHAIDITTSETSSQEERQILRGIINFSNIYVKQIMRPRTSVEAFEVKQPYAELIKSINENRYSRIPVYQDSFDHVVGILYIKDLIPFLSEGPEFQWTNLLREPYFVPETKKIDLLLEEFQLKKVHMAVVVDEYGGTSGIATLEDIVEEIVGDIHDEFDEEEVMYSKLDDNNYIFDGRTALTDVMRIINEHDDVFDVIRGEAETIGGLTVEIAGRIPTLNETFTCKNLHLTAEQVDRRRVLRVKVQIMPQQEKVS